MATTLEHDPEEQVRPLRRVEYDRLVELGVFDDERIELLNGRLVRMSPQGSRHSIAVMALVHRIMGALPAGFWARPQMPFAAADDSEPEPDFAIMQAESLQDIKGHPSQAPLVIEVSDSSLAKDRRKARIYATAGVPEYWIVNLVEELVEVYTDPVGDHYVRVEPHRPGEVLTPACLPGLAIPVSDVIPPRT